MGASTVNSRAALTFALLVPVVGLPAATRAEEPTRLEVSAGEAHRAREDWYGIYSGENKLGYVRNTLRADDASGRLVVENEMHLKVVALGEKREVRSLERLEFAPEAPHELLGGSGTVEQGQYTQEISLASTEAGFEASIQAGGEVRTMDLAQLDYTLADILTPEIWFSSARSPGDSISTRSFALTDLNPAVDTYRVEGLKRTLVDGVPVSYYEVGLHSSVAGDVGTALIDEQGRLVSGVLGGAFELRRESAELAPDFDYSGDVYLLGMAEIDSGLGDPRDITSLRLAVEGDDPGTIPSSPNQQVVFDEATGTWILTIGAGVGTPRPATAQEIDDALQESVEHPIRNDRIVELARQAVAKADEPAAQVEALVLFVDDFLSDSYSAEPLTVLDMLTTRQGDCTEHALLFTTLARAIGIPTREVTGLLYLGDDVQAFGGHAWNEVVLDGHWTPVDATWGEARPNATHIRLGTRIGEDAALTNLFANYSFRLLEIGRQ